MIKVRQKNRFIFACLISMLIPLLLGNLAYFRACVLLKSNAIEMNQAVLENARDLMDAQYEAIDLLCSQVFSTVTQSQLLHPENLTSSQIQIHKLNLIKAVERIIPRAGNISSYYLYLKPIHSIITKNSSYSDPGVFYTENMEGDKELQEQWQALLDGQKRLLIAQTDLFSSSSNLCFYRSFPLFPSVESKGCIVINVSLEKLHQYFAPLKENGGAYFVIDNDGTVILASEKLSGSVELLRSEGRYRREDTRRDCIVTNVASKTCGWTYYAVTDTDQIFSSLNIYRKLYRIMLATIVAVGTIASLILAVRAMRPVTKLIDEQHRLEHVLSRQNSYISTNFWEKLIHGEFATRERLDEALDYAGIREQAESYFAISIDFGEENPQDIERALSIQLKEEIFFYRSKTLLVCIPRTADFPDQAGIVNAVSGALGAINSGAIFGVSDSHELMRFNLSCFQAETALGHARAANLPYAVHNEYSGLATYLKPVVEFVDRLNNALMAGKINDTAQILAELRGEVLTEKKSSFFIRLQVIYEIRHIIVRCTSLVPMEEEIDQVLISNLNKVGYQHALIDEYDMLCDTLISICALREQKLTKDQTFNQNDEIVSYLNEHYADLMLSLRMVAERFQLNESYFSTVFKQNTGVNFADYIQQLRINKAIELICGKEQSISEIAQEIGYANDQTFRRAFKRVIGVSPTAYRAAYYGNTGNEENEP